MYRLIHRGRRFLSAADPCFLALGVAAALEGLLVAFGGFSAYFTDHFTMIPWVFFLACTWKQPLSSAAKKLLLISAAVVLWFTVVQYYHQTADGLSRLPGPFFKVYLLALPFAAVTGDGKRKLGLKLSGGIFLCAALVLACFIGLFYVGQLPGLLESSIYWDGARLRALRHPNITGNCFLIATGFSLYFFVCARKRWHKAVFLTLAALFFLVIILTNSRTAILITCSLAAGTVFFLIWKGGVKRFLLGAAAAAVAFVLLFGASRVIFPLHQHRLIQSYLQEQADTGTTNSDLVVDEETGEASLYTDAGQNSLIHDIGTLNARTSIWRTCLLAIRNDPMILIRGLSDIPKTITDLHSWPLPHSHNSWMEVLLGLGLPGLLFSLFFTGLALWHIFRVCFLGSHSLPRKVIAMLALCMLIGGIPENVLFYPSVFYQCADFVFFLCLGYLIQWTEKDAPSGDTPEA